MNTNRLLVLALALVMNGVTVGVSVAQTQHSNGLGQNYSSPSALGTPGNAGTYTQTMAQAAAAAWPSSGNVSSAKCGSIASAPLVVFKQAPTSCAAWAYTASVAGRVHLNMANNSCLCPSTTDPTWN
jgi:hypothetical protein